jgi:hypothetical protein
VSALRHTGSHLHGRHDNVGLEADGIGQIEPMFDKNALSGADRSADEDSRGMPRQVLPVLVG